ncbi:TRM11 family SAM-dependent methyltransferase [Luteimicrobium sp. NPDC057192]|uniref:TRM11 family SAM-dependent methyltransferase n=1 Tax=Luteimicrobium sp. NPDC057192 TaxID=3346042 RepID=UPI00363F604D
MLPVTRYAFLVSPSHNRVYAQAAPALAVAEMAVLAERAFEGRLRDVGTTTLGGLPYVTFTLDDAARPDTAGTDLALLSALSSAYALFVVDGDGDDATLRPVTRAAVDLFDSDLLTVQKYAGKTNEDFTRLLVNVTVAATDRPRDLAGPWTTRPDGARRRLRVLDPMAGRGTTLNQALVRGWDAAGVDVDQKDVEAYATFLRTWLKNHRLKHTAGLSTVRRDGRSLGRRFEATVGATADEYRAGDTIAVELVNADTVRAADLFPAGHFDAIVTDAPYGVQHGNRASGTRGAGGRSTPHDELTRSPVPLLTKALPGWVRLLRRGGAVGISWNVRVAPRAALEDVLRDAGLEVLGDVRDDAAPDPWHGFEHRVDQAIQRDLVVARKPR